MILGYSIVSKTCKVYHPQIGKTTITTDAHFCEDGQGVWSNSYCKKRIIDSPKRKSKNNLRTDE